MTVLLEACGLSAGYGGTAVVRNLDLRVSAGQVVALLGPNGAGKTTTMLSLVGDLPPVAGEVRFLGESRRSRLHQRAKRGLSFVTEERSVFMDLTVRQNIGVGGCDVARVTALFPELEPLLGRRAGLLSGGEQQMLTLGRALARPGAKLLLADELSLGLAPQAVTRLLRAVRAAADAGMAVLLVEQHVHRVLEIADHVHVLSQGGVRWSGPAADARERLDDIRAHYLARGTTAHPSRSDPRSPTNEEMA